MNPLQITRGSLKIQPISLSYKIWRATRLKIKKLRKLEKRREQIKLTQKLRHNDNAWWFYLHFFEFIFIYFIGLKVMINLRTNYNKNLEKLDWTGLYFWIYRHKKTIKFFKKLYISLYKILKFAWISFWYTKPQILGKHLCKVLSVMNFWKQKKIYYLLRRLFRYYSLRQLNFTNFTNLAGLKLKFKGKIAAGGNSRTRTIYYKEGYTGIGNYSTHVTYSTFVSPNVPGTVNLQLFYYKLNTDYTAAVL